jgi:hypothetical protein
MVLQFLVAIALILQFLSGCSILSNLEIDQYLEVFIPRYTQKTKTSKLRRQSNRPVLTDPQTPRRLAKFLLLSTKINYPIIATKVKGSRLRNIDGDEYVDIGMGMRINLFCRNPMTDLLSKRDLQQIGCKRISQSITSNAKHFFSLHYSVILP